MTEIRRERYGWYNERVRTSHSIWDMESVLSNPEKYLANEESPFCKCGHHVKDHGYSSFFGEELFCFYKLGNEQYEPIFVDHQGNRIDSEDLEDDLTMSLLETRLNKIEFARALSGIHTENRRCACEGFEPHRIMESVN